MIEKGGRVVGWLRTASTGDTGRFELMAEPSRREVVDGLIEDALERLEEHEKLTTIVPGYATALLEQLAAHGFEERDEFVVLARRTQRPIAIPELAPVSPA